MHRRADAYCRFRRHHHPDLLVSGLAGQHNVGSERLGHPQGERKALGRNSRFQILWTYAQYNLAISCRRGRQGKRSQSNALLLDRQGQKVHWRAADKAANEGGRRRGIDFGGWPDLLDAAGVQHSNTIGKAHSFCLVVRHIDGGCAGLAQHRLQFGTHLEPQQRIEVRQRLVHQQH